MEAKETVYHLFFWYSFWNTKLENWKTSISLFFIYKFKTKREIFACSPYSWFVTALVNHANFVLTFCKQFISQRRPLKEIHHNDKPLFLLLCCSRPPNRETTGSKCLVRTHFFLSPIQALCQSDVLLNSLPHLQGLILSYNTGSILWIPCSPLMACRHTTRCRASPAFLSAACPLLPRCRWHLTLSANCSLLMPCWLRSLSWADRMSWSRPSSVKLKTLGQYAKDRLTASVGRGGQAPATQEESHLKVLERGGCQIPEARGARVSMSRLLKGSSSLVRWD